MKIQKLSDEHLKKTELKPWLEDYWCIPPKNNAAFICAMEDVLEVYQHAFATDEVLICMGENSKQHIK